MPYADPAQQRAYQRRWIAQKRTAYLAGKVCSHCDATDRLEVHHKDPSEKLSHRIWSWSEKRRAEELAKCIILCYDCHKAQHAAKHGTRNRYRNGCRCWRCTVANAKYHRDYRARRRERELARGH